ncbi:MAG: NAD(P)H-dependent oxidoreductase [Calditrichia bacterium]
MDKIKILGFAGSLRKGSFNRALLRVALEAAPENVEIDTFDIAPIPLFNEDVRLQGVPVPVAFMGSGGGLGTARAQYHLRQVAVFTEMLPLNKPEVFVPRAWEKFDAEGNLLDPKIKEKVRGLLEALAVWTIRLKK